VPRKASLKAGLSNWTRLGIALVSARWASSLRPATFNPSTFHFCVSLKILTRAWNTDCRTPCQKLMLAALADYANDSGRCWPSLTSLAKKCSLSRQGVINQLRGLQKVGLIEIEKKGGFSNRYRLSLDKLAPDTSQRRGLPLVNGIDHHPYTPLTGVVNRVDPIRKEPPTEPSRGRLPPAERIWLEKEKRELDKRINTLRCIDSRNIEEGNELRASKLRVKKIQEALFIPL